MFVQAHTPSGLPAISPTRGEITHGTASPHRQKFLGAIKPLPLMEKGWGGVLTTKTGGAI
ncbi:hypothetical protein DTW90_02695 [Neorhizobium sp. P12A]|nr:hypothetical protein DTW90_02695 [Neorhizobium sp. P12A]